MRRLTGIGIGLIAGFLLALPGTALAQAYEKTINYSLPAGKTFAVRSLCPTEGRLFLRAYLASDPNGFLAPLAFASAGYCVNGRIGLSFTVPPGAARQPIALWVGWDVTREWKIVLEPDCGDTAASACVLPISRDPSTFQEVGKAAGQFTWPGDEDWYRIDANFLDQFRTTVPRNTCVAVGKIVRGVGDVPYVVLSGGPAGCTYTVTATERPGA